MLVGSLFPPLRLLPNLQAAVLLTRQNRRVFGEILVVVVIVLVLHLVHVVLRFVVVEEAGGAGQVGRRRQEIRHRLVRELPVGPVADVHLLMLAVDLVVVGSLRSI